MQPTHVRKRDGRLVAFDLQKLSRSIKAALESAGDSGAAYAEDIAYAIALHLGKTFPQQPPQTADVAAAVSKALEKAYSPRAGAVYLDYRVARDEQRSRCQVVKPLQISLLDADASVNVMSGHEQNSQPWNRSLIVRALEQEAHVGRNVAEKIAQAVEQRVLSSGLPVVTTTLIRALTDSELLANGYANALRQRSSVTLPYDSLEHGLRQPEKLWERLGSHVAIPYALSHIYSEDVAMAHRQGLIGIGSLKHPFGRFMERVSPRADESPRDLRRHWTAALNLVSCGLGERLLCSLSQDFMRTQPRERLLEMRDTAAVLGVECLFELPNSCLNEMPELLGEAGDEGGLFWLFTGECRNISETAAGLLELSMRGHNSGWIKNPLSPLSQTVSVNIPQRVYKKEGVEEILMGLQPALEAAVHAHRQYRLYAQANGRLRVSDVGGCELIGLREAAQAFAGEDTGAQVKVASAILSAASEIVHRLSGAYYFDMQLVSGLSSEEGRRFAAIDQRLFPELFGFGFLPFGASDADALRHAIPPYRLTESFQGDGPQEILAWNSLLLNHCDMGFLRLSAEEAGQDLLEALLTQGFGLLLSAGARQGAESASYLKGQASFL